MPENNTAPGFSISRDHIDTFLSIVRCHTLSAAAKELFVDQSTVSHRLKAIEEGLNVTLFSRNRGLRTLSLTEEGELFLKMAENWSNLLEEMAVLHTRKKQIPLSVGSISSINLYLLNPFLTDLVRREKRLRLDVSNHSSEQIYRRLEHRELDIGFAFSPPHYKNLEATPVFSEPMVLLIPYQNDYPNTTISPGVLKRSNEVFFPWPTNAYQQWHDSWWDKSESPVVTLSTSSLMSMFMAVSDNWSVCPASMAQYLKQARAADFRFFDSPPPERVSYLLQRKALKNERNESARIFLPYFEQFLSNHPWRYWPGR